MLSNLSSALSSRQEKYLFSITLLTRSQGQNSKMSEMTYWKLLSFFLILMVAKFHHVKCQDFDDNKMNLTKEKKALLAELAGLSIGKSAEVTNDVDRNDLLLEDDDSRLLTRNSSAEENENCVKKVVMVSEVVYDHEIRCEHTPYNTCFPTYVSNFKSVETEECEEVFVKKCTVEMIDVPTDEKVEICHDNLVRDCNATDPDQTTCSREFQTVCQTIYKEFEVQEDVPNCVETREEVCKIDDNGDTVCDFVPKQQCNVTTETNTKVNKIVDCDNQPIEVCGPEECPIIQGEKTCTTEVREIISQVPREDCDIIPQKSCKQANKLVPVLERSEECLTIQKEICIKEKVNPVRRRRPVIKTVCGQDLE